MPQLANNPYLVSFSTSFGTPEEDNNFFKNREIRLFLATDGFSEEDIDCIITQLQLQRTQDLCVCSINDLNQLQQVSSEGMSRLQEIVSWAQQNKHKFDQRFAALERIENRLNKFSPPTPMMRK